MTVTLEKYLESKETSPGEFARQINVNPSTIYRTLANKTKPSPLLQDIIIQATRGEVSFDC
jgi:predicted transcriptional regulator